MSPKLTNVKRVENYSHTRKTKGPKHGIDSSLERALEVFEQISEDMGQKKTPEILSQTGGDRLKSQTFLSENQRSSEYFSLARNSKKV